MRSFQFASLFLLSGEECVAGYRYQTPSSPLPCPSEDRIEASDRVAQEGVCSTLDTKRRAKVRHLRTELTRAR